MTARCFALIPAAGTGSRLGAAIPKQYLLVAGTPMIVRTLAAFAAVPRITGIVVVVAPDDERFERLALDADCAERVQLVRAGGATRDESVTNALVALGDVVEDDDWILVHDAARCGIAPDVVAGLIERLADDPVGGLLAMPMDDTVKRQRDGGLRDDRRPPSVASTVDRRGLWRAQTPQMFRYRLLLDALLAARRGGLAVTDESSAMEAAGHRPVLVPGSARNFKVTSADDLALMEALLQASSTAPAVADLSGEPSPR